MNLTEMSIVRAAITEKAAGEVSEDYDNLCLAGMDRKEQASIRGAAKEGEKVAWRNHHKAAYEATARFLQNAGVESARSRRKRGKK